MNELLIAIALWCGNPVYTTAYTKEGFKSFSQVNECRERLYKCYTTNQVPAIKMTECFLKEKL